MFARVQWRATKQLLGFRNLAYLERLLGLNPCNVECRRSAGNLILPKNILITQELLADKYSG